MAALQLRMAFINAAGNGAVEANTLWMETDRRDPVIALCAPRFWRQNGDEIGNSDATSLQCQT